MVEESMECSYTICAYGCCINNRCGYSYWECYPGTIIMIIIAIIFGAIFLIFFMCWLFSCFAFRNKKNERYAISPDVIQIKDNERRKESKEQPGVQSYYSNDSGAGTKHINRIESNNEGANEMKRVNLESSSEYNKSLPLEDNTPYTFQMSNPIQTHIESIGY